MPASDDKENGIQKAPPAIDRVEDRWVVGTPAVPDFGKRTLTAMVALLLLLGMLYLLAR